MPRRQRFADWLQEEMEPSDIRDLAEHGAAAGFPGLTYYKDTVALYEKFEDELWEMVREAADDYGAKNPLAFLAEMNGAEGVEDDTTFKNLVVWYCAETVAQQLSEELEDDEDY